MEISNIDILSLIPQRAPFVMVDKLTHYDENSARSSFMVKSDNIFTKDGVLTEPALVENIAQTAAARAGYTSSLEKKPVALGYIGAIQNLEIIDLPKSDEELTTEIIVKNQVFDVTLVSGTVKHKENLLAKCDMKIFITKIP